MKELIEKLSLGVTEYTKPVAEADTNEISLNMEAEKTYSGSFRVISANGKALKGIIFSTDNRLVIKNNQFIGMDNEIWYEINTFHVSQGEEIAGNINIVSSGGEISIPFHVTVDSVSANTTTGNVKNLFHFANLVQMSYDEALKLFKSKEFPHIFLENDLELMAVYNGLTESPDGNIAMEEFLVAANKKKPVRISVSKTGSVYDNIEEDYGDTIVISKDTWGYVSISIEVSGSFIKTDRTALTSNDFAGSNYELSYHIRKNSLHGGKNMGRIRFITSHQTIDYIITVNMDGEGGHRDREYKKAVAVVLDRYLDFRMHRTDLNRWAEESDAAITRARGSSDTMFMKLHLAHIYITGSRESEGAWLLESVAEDLLPVREEEPELYCYYLYVRAIQKRDDAFTEESIRKIRDCYENGCDSWRILWILFYLDEMYDSNISLKVLRMKEQYRNGMRSPLMYFEALSCFNEVPEMLRVLDDFEIQVLNFGLKREYISEKLAAQLGDIVMTEKRFNPIVFRILKKLYEWYEEPDMLWNICSMLIKCNQTEEKYFRWFELGVGAEMKITGLYEYYMYTISDDFDGVIPRSVMMYFAYNHTALPDEKADLLYANIVQNKDKLRTVYDAYRLQLEKYVSDNIMLGRMNEKLAVIYRDILNKAMIGSELSERLPDVINTYEIRCHEDTVREVIVVHKEIKDYEKYPLKKGKAYVRIHTEDAVILFEDVEGNRYCKSVKYEKKRLLDMEEYLRMCYEISSGNRALILYFGDRYLKYRKEPEKSVSVLKYMLNMDNLTEPFRILVEQAIINYYSSNYDGDSLDEYLLSVQADSLGTSARIKIIELAVMRGLYERAYELIERYGFYKVEPRRVLKCVAKLIELKEFREEKLIVDMAAFAFVKGKYNEESLRYLGEFYNGTTKELLALWKASKGFRCESRELEERIVVQMLFSGAYVRKIEEVYDSYSMKGASSRIKKAYLFSKSYDYFVRENVIEENVFKYIEREVCNGDEVNDMCGLAYLKYMSEQGRMAQDKIRPCKKLLYELCRVNKVFEFYKKFKPYFRLPYAILDKTIVEYRTNPENRVFIHYISGTGENRDDTYSVAEMTAVCDGIFTFNFVLFYGENVQYYITEECDGETAVGESRNIFLTEVEFNNDSTHYGMINDMLICREMKEEKTFKQMARDYLEKRELMDIIFEIRKS